MHPIKCRYLHIIYALVCSYMLYIYIYHVYDMCFSFTVQWRPRCGATQLYTFHATPLAGNCENFLTDETACLESYAPWALLWWQLCGRSFRKGHTSVLIGCLKHFGDYYCWIRIHDAYWWLIKHLTNITKKSSNLWILIYWCAVVCQREMCGSQLIRFLKLARSPSIKLGPWPTQEMLICGVQRKGCPQQLDFLAILIVMFGMRACLSWPS